MNTSEVKSDRGSDTGRERERFPKLIAVSAEEFANQAAERVRAVIKEAEDRAAEIVREAEEEAARIRERAEADVRERLERARELLSDVGAAPAPQPSQPAETPEPAASAQPEETAESPPPPEAEAQVPGGADEGAARLVAMKMALEGKGREEIESALAERFGAADRSALVDDVLARAGR